MPRVAAAEGCRVDPRRGSRPIVVGIDARSDTDAALLWAVNEAALRDRTLHVVAALAVPVGRARVGRGLATPAPSDDADAALERAEQLAAASLTGYRVTTELSSDSPIRSLGRAAAAAELVVVGSDQHAVRQSVAHAVAAHAGCPVVVVPPRLPATRRHLVVGSDGSAESDQALAFAFDEAVIRGASIEVVHGWRPMASEPRYRRWIERTEENFQEQLRDSVAPYRSKYPDVPVVERVLEGSPVDQLARRSAEADLVVVGSRGLGRIVGRLLGSVSQGLLDHAECPVAVVKKAW
jgi:nucleotide-binding universal stress UspA family protein